MAAEEPGGSAHVPVADISIDIVRPQAEGFTLEGRGNDGADYRLDLHLDMPVSPRTRTVLGEMLAQSEWRISRRVRVPLRARARRSSPAQKA